MPVAPRGRQAWPPFGGARRSRPPGRALPGGWSSGDNGLVTDDGFAPDAIRSPFYEAQRRMGGVFGDWDGWIWTTGFGDTEREYRAVRDDVGVWDCAGLIKWDVRGRDAIAALDHLCANDIAGLSDGQVRYTAMLDDAGRLVDDCTVYRFSNEHAWFMTNRLDLDEHIAAGFADFDATAVCIVHDLPHVQLQGPRSRELLAGLTDRGIGDLRYFRFLTEQATVGGVPTWIARTGVSGELGFELFVRPADAETLWASIVGAGATPYGFDAVDILRIESGMILPAYDYTPDETSPLDIDFERFMRPEKPEFVGRDAVRAAAVAPPRRLISLAVEGDEVPEAGAEVRVDGRVVGALTSPTTSPRLGVIGLGVVETAAARAGAPAEVAVEYGWATARISLGALYDAEKRRPRT
jgi:aminomethyltransferase